MGTYVDAEGWIAGPTGYGRRRYRAYVPHPLADWNPRLRPEAVSAVTAAHGALDRLAALPETHLGTAIADWVIARDESIRSSVMEGVAATEEGLAWARYMDQAGQPVSDDNDALTLGAAKQVTAAVLLGERMHAGGACTLNDIRSMHGTLFEGTRDRVIGGEWRDGPIWVGPAGCGIDDASVVAPPEEAVPALVEDLVVYLNSDAHPAALQAAVAHAQFETIHPFEDGNGRTGRALIQTVLNARGVARGTVPVSAALSRDVPGYHAALNATRFECEPGDSMARSSGIEEWLALFCRACEDAERQAASVVRSVEAIASRWRLSARFRSDSAAAALLKILPSMPVLDAEMVAERLEVTKRTARSAIEALVRAQIVSPVGGRRNRRYTVPDLVDLVRAMGPDAGPLPSRGTPPAAPAPPLAPRIACGYRGPRSNRGCVLPKGHLGQHRYSW